MKATLPVGKFIAKYKGSRGFCVFRTDRGCNCVALFSQQRLAEGFCKTGLIGDLDIEPATISYKELFNLLLDRGPGDIDIDRVILDADGLNEEWAYAADAGDLAGELDSYELHTLDIATVEATLRRIDWPRRSVEGESQTSP
ncbi:MAG: hypothetical protein R3C45_22180 [Phycisphaerales bacterium]